MFLNVEDVGLDGVDIKIDFKEIGWKMWTEFFWLGTGTRCWLL
jgi:hypothetical protein